MLPQGFVEGQTAYQNEPDAMIDAAKKAVAIQRMLRDFGVNLDERKLLGVKHLRNMLGIGPRLRGQQGRVNCTLKVSPKPKGVKVMIVEFSPSELYLFLESEMDELRDEASLLGIDPIGFDEEPPEGFRNAA